MIDLFKKIKKLPNIRIIYHLLAWMTLLLLLTFFETKDDETHISTYFTNELINIFFYAVIFYFNTEYLIPQYLSKDKFWRYLGLLILSAIIITPIKIFVLYMKFGYQNQDQSLLTTNQFGYYILSLITAASSTVIRITTDWAKQIRERKDLETKNMQSELNFLKSQINPHFLFNTLNSLYALTLKKSDEAPDIVIKLSEMMRYMLYECNEKRVPLSKEINYIRNYLDLEKLRQVPGFKIDFEIEGSEFSNAETKDGRKILTKEYTIAPLMFIPFIENSFKHGANTSIGGGFVNIQMHINDGEINLLVENSKTPHIPQPEHRRSGGIGLVNVKRRLDLIYPNQYQLEIENTPETYSINLWLKLD
jgi:two-component system, LytTR family, sensor kinase